MHQVRRAVKYTPPRRRNGGTAEFQERTEIAGDVEFRSRFVRKTPTLVVSRFALVLVALALWVV